MPEVFSLLHSAQMLREKYTSWGHDKVIEFPLCASRSLLKYRFRGPPFIALTCFNNLQGELITENVDEN